MGPDELLAEIKARRTIRKVSEESIGKEIVERILTAAIWAPSPHNAQPWRFIIVRDPSKKHELLVEMGEKWKEDLRSDGMQEGVIESMVSSSINRFSSCPLLIIVTVTMEDMDRYPDERRRKAEKTMAIQGASAAVQNMLLMTHALGIGAGWSCSPLFAPEVTKKALGIRNDWDPIAMIALGFPLESPEPPRRKGLDQVTTWI